MDHDVNPTVKMLNRRSLFISASLLRFLVRYEAKCITKMFFLDSALHGLLFIANNHFNGTKLIFILWK